MAQSSALLRPMRADSLLRPGAPQTLPAEEKAAIMPAPTNRQPLMRPPTFAPRRVPACPAPPEPAEELDRLWENLAWLQEDAPADPEDADDDGEDAVPTDQMPVPVPVPLDLFGSARSGRRGRWVWLGALAALAAAGCALWQLDWLPF